jgi:translation initiation factor 2B subunit (eIF-2B alpha/beta/delta family)
VLVVDDQSVTGNSKMVKELTAESIESYGVSVASVFTIMPKITKVIVGSFAVMADGGILGFSGIYALGMVHF